MTVISIDLGATRTRAALLSSDGKIIAKVEALTLSECNDAADFVKSVIALIERLDLGNSGPLNGIGLSVAGQVDLKTGSIVKPPNLNLHSIPIAGPLRERFKVEVSLLNDCHAGVLGEYYYGSGRGSRHLVYITISTGIGGGVISDGHLLLGAERNAVEIGHFLVDTTYNLKCGCGFVGHWEAYGSGRNIPKFYQEWLKTKGLKSEPDITSSGLYKRANEGDPIAEEFIDILGKIHARGISDVIVAYNPDRIVLDGSVVLSNRDLILEQIYKYADRYLDLPQIVVSELNGEAPLIGAAVATKVPSLILPV